MLPAVLLAAGAMQAQAATLSGSYTADDNLKIYLSTDLTASIDELIDHKTSSWGSTESFTGFALTPGQSAYLLVEAINFTGPAMFVGNFEITGDGFGFANGSNALLTNTLHWTVSETSFAAATATPVSLGANAPGLQIWGQRASIDPGAEAIWAYYADWSAGRGGSAYFVTQITAVPEPATSGMFAAGLAVLGLALRRMRRS
jgi:hypothetical protein